MYYPYQIPKKWEVERLENICHLVTDGTHKTPQYVEHGIRFISIANIKPFQNINWRNYEKFITLEEHKELIKRAKPEIDDILFPRIGTLGYAKRIDFKEEVSIFVGLGLAKPNKNFVLPKYLEFFMNTLLVYIYSHENATGTGRLTLPLEASRKMPILIPPLPEQHRIVAKIEELFSELDKGVESLKAAQEQLKIFRQAVLKWAFDGKLTEEKTTHPQKENIRWVAIESTCNVSGGITKNGKRVELSLKFPYLRVANVYSNRLELNEIVTIGITEQEKERTLLQEGDLLFVEGNGSIDQIGRVAIWKGQIKNCVHQNHLIKVRPHTNVESKYLLYYFLSSEGRSQIKDKASCTSGLYTLSISKIGQLKFPFRERQEQIAVVQEIESRLSVCDKMEEAIEQSLAQAEALRQSILKKAFEGKLVPQDPDDEPAEKLLTRIRTERQGQQTTKKTGRGRTKK